VREVVITISAKAGDGKTTIANHLGHILGCMGFDCTIDDIDEPMLVRESAKRMSDMVCRNEHHITIRTQQQLQRVANIAEMVDKARGHVAEATKGYIGDPLTSSQKKSLGEQAADIFSNAFGVPFKTVTASLDPNDPNKLIVTLDRTKE
jgi:hypothetical protein